MISITARLDLNIEPGDLLAQYGLERGGRVQKIIDEKVIEYSDPYTPASPFRGLAKSPKIATEIGSGRVIWDTEYARYQYYGFVMTDELGRTWVRYGEKKPIVTDRALTYDTSQNPLAGSHWFERMKADRLNDILDEARRAMLQGE